MYIKEVKKQLEHKVKIVRSEEGGNIMESIMNQDMARSIC